MSSSNVISLDGRYVHLLVQLSEARISPFPILGTLTRFSKVHSCKVAPRSHLSLAYVPLIRSLYVNVHVSLGDQEPAGLGKQGCWDART